MGTDYQFRTVSYRIGEAKILELRVSAQKALGEKFKLRDFHDEVLRDGSMPLAVLKDEDRALDCAAQQLLA